MNDAAHQIFSKNAGKKGVHCCMQCTPAPDLLLWLEYV
jgi:hypothetical protein